MENDTKLVDVPPNTIVALNTIETDNVPSKSVDNITTSHNLSDSIKREEDSGFIELTSSEISSINNQSTSQNKSLSNQSDQQTSLNRSSDRQSKFSPHTNEENCSLSNNDHSTPSTSRYTESAKKPLEFFLKDICFKDRFFKVILQNENGPCPLLAIANALILRSKITLPNRDKISSDDLMSIVSEYLFSEPYDSSDSVNATIYESNLSQALQTFPKLLIGLDINIKFDSVSSFEFTDSLSLFDVFGINLYHVWVVDPQNFLLYSLLDGKSYNQAIEMLIDLKSSNDPDDSPRYEMLDEFLESSRNQVTFEGVIQLTTRMKDDEISILFRNNHFNTIIKHSGSVYSLVTDLGMLEEKDVIWETFNDTKGNTEFLDANFRARQQASDTLAYPDPLPESMRDDFSAKENIVIKESIKQKQPPKRDSCILS